MTMKTIKGGHEKGWEAGEHYEKDWLKAKVPELSKRRWRRMRRLRRW